MRAKALLAVLVLVLLLAACQLPQQQVTQPTNQPSADEVATEVSKILTQAPTATTSVVTLPTQAATNTLPVVPTATQQVLPTETTAPTAEPVQPTAAPPTETATVAPTPEPAFTPPAGDPRASLGSPTWRDTMDSDRGWPTDTDQFSSLSVKDGSLVMTALDSVDGWRVTWPEVKDYYLEMTVRTGTCAGSDHFGFIVRVPDIHSPGEGYLVGLTCDGRYSIREWDGEDMTSLIRWSSSTAIKTGSNAVNRLGVMVVGSRLAVYANGALLGEVTDSSYTQEGGFGLFVGSDETENFTIYVDEMAYWENPGQ